VVPTNDTKADDVLLLVENLEALGAACSGEAGDDVDLPETADFAVADEEVAALDEVLVCLRVVEAADDGPDGGDGGGDVFHHGGATLVGAHRVCVVEGHGFWDVGWGDAPFEAGGRWIVVGGGGVHCGCGCGSLD
jgi:hypothetical protein